MKETSKRIKEILSKNIPDVSITSESLDITTDIVDYMMNSIFNHQELDIIPLSEYGKHYIFRKISRSESKISTSIITNPTTGILAKPMVDLANSCIVECINSLKYNSNRVTITLYIISIILHFAAICVRNDRRQRITPYDIWLGVSKNSELSYLLRSIKPDIPMVIENKNTIGMYTVKFIDGKISGLSTLSLIPFYIKTIIHNIPSWLVSINYQGRIEEALNETIEFNNQNNNDFRRLVDHISKYKYSMTIE